MGYNTPTLVPVLVEGLLQYIVNTLQADSMPGLLAVQVPPRAETVSVLLSTFQLLFPVPLFLVKHRSPCYIPRAIT